jgi:hypothetical protein
MEQTALMDILNAYIAECNVLNKIVIAAVDGQTTLVVHLRFAVAEDVDVVVC